MGAKKVAQEYPKLNSLVLNAGIMWNDFALTEDGIESQIGTNHVGHQLLTQLLLPQVEAAAASAGIATIVSVTSSYHYECYPEGILPSVERMNDPATYSRFGAYGQSKLANVLFAQELAERLEGKNILVNSVHPGGVNTELTRHMEDFVASFSPILSERLTPLIKSPSWEPEDAALSQLYLAVGLKLKQAKVTGKYFHPIAREHEPHFHAFNKTLQNSLWKLTEDFIAAH